MFAQQVEGGGPVGGVWGWGGEVEGEEGVVDGGFLGVGGGFLGWGVWVWGCGGGGGGEEDGVAVSACVRYTWRKVGCGIAYSSAFV